MQETIDLEIWSTNPFELHTGKYIGMSENFFQCQTNFTIPMPYRKSPLDTGKFFPTLATILQCASVCVCEAHSNILEGASIIFLVYKQQGRSSSMRKFRSK